MAQDFALSFTPGPWVYAYGAVYTADLKTRLLLADRNEPETRPTERDRNMQLAAVAPEMLEALERMECQFEFCEGPDKPVEDGITCFRCAAIRKARLGNEA